MEHSSQSFVLYFLRLRTLVSDSYNKIVIHINLNKNNWFLVSGYQIIRMSKFTCTVGDIIGPVVPFLQSVTFAVDENVKELSNNVCN